MILYSRETLIAGLLLLTSVNALPKTELERSSHTLSKPAKTGKWDKNCDVKYGALTAKQWLDKSWEMLEPLSKAGHDGLDNIVELLEFKAGISQTDPKISEAEQLRLVPLYEIMFGEIKGNDATKALDKADVEKHITQANVIMESLKRLEDVGINKKPYPNIHCGDDFLREKDLNNKPYSGKTKAVKGKVWRYNTDSMTWEQYTNNGKVCVGDKAGVTFFKKPGQKTPETMVICPAYFKFQPALKAKQQLQLWELDRAALPPKYWNMKENKEDDYHMAAFGRMIANKFFHQMMLTSMFHPVPNYFDDQPLSTTKLAYTFIGATELATKNKNLAAKNIDTIVYWSIANYFNKYHWETGYARLPKAEPQQEQEGESDGAGGKEKDKRSPRGGRSGGGRGGRGRGGGHLNGGSRRPTRKHNAPLSTQAPHVSTRAPPASTPLPHTSIAVPATSKTAAPRPSSSETVQAPASSNALSRSLSAPTASTKSSATITSVPSSLTHTPTGTASSTSSKHCSGTLCTSTRTSSHSSSSSTRKEPAITLSPDPISAEDVNLAAASKLEASVQAWESAGAGVLALWGLSGVLPTGTVDAGNGTVKLMKPRSTAVPEVGEVRVGEKWWARYLF